MLTPDLKTCFDALRSAARAHERAPRAINDGCAGDPFRIKSRGPA